MFGEDQNLSDGLRAILQACLASPAPILRPPRLWVNVPLQVHVLEINGLHWEVGLWCRPDVNQFTAIKLVNLVTIPHLGVKALGHEDDTASALYEAYGIYVCFHRQETIH